LVDFKQDILDLFDRKRGGHVQHWLYTDSRRGDQSGADLWRAFTRSSRAYYIPRDEVALIQEYAPTMVASSDADTVVDFGVGSRAAIRSKVMPIIRRLQNARLYVGVDISEAFLTNANNIVRQEAPALEVNTHHRDFHAGPIACGGDKRLGLLFGCSVTNQEMMEGDGFPRRAILRNLRDFKDHLGKGSELLVTYDMNHHGDQVTNAYRSADWSRHVTGLTYDVARLLQKGGDFDPAAWRHEMIWNDQVKVLHHCIVAEKAQTLELDNRTYQFNQHERFVAANNFKFSHELFSDLCQEAGFISAQSAAHKSIVLQHLGL